MRKSKEGSNLIKALHCCFWCAVVLQCVTIHSFGLVAPLAKRVRPSRRTSSSSLHKTVASQNSVDASPVAVASPCNNPITCALLQISYDGTRFSGWSASNQNPASASTKNNMDPPRNNSRRRKRGIHSLSSNGRPRSVEGVIRAHLARVGNTDPKNVVVEGTSRTDKGVSAKCQVALIYYLKPDVADFCGQEEGLAMAPAISGKRLPHPRNSTDNTSFQALPKDIEQLGFTLNRMLPPDVRVMQVAKMPDARNTSHNNNQDKRVEMPFHPSLCNTFKTYEYHLSFGALTDPTNRRLVWYAGDEDVSLELLEEAAKVLTGVHDFAAFRGAARGSSDKKKFEQQETICNVSSITIQATQDQPFSTNVVISLQGDRFLYKMVRFMVGAMVAVANGSLSLSDLQQMLDQTAQRPPFTCAPAHALILEHIEFDPTVWDIQWKAVNS